MLKYFFCGGVIVSTPVKYKEKILNIFMKNDILYKNLIIDNKNNKLIFSCTLYTFKKLNKIFENKKIEVKIEKVSGIPHIFKKHRRRYGIFLGFMVSFFVVILSRQFIWDIRISDSSFDNREHILCMLNENGLKIGTHVKNLDIDEIENKILISSDMLSWISINLKGNVAYVQARNRLGNKNSESLTPANVVASRDGLVQEIEAYAGEIKIHNGQHVRKGDLLIGGIYDSNSRGYRYLRAKGNVFATTVRDIHIEIPFDYKEKVYTGMQKSENIYVFFSNRIKLSRNSRFLGATYDTIYRESEFCLPGGTRLPFSKCTITYIGYEYEDKVRSEEQAAELAYGQLESEISDILSEGATFIRKSITCGSDDSSYVIDCVLTLNENIAEISEFEVSD